MKNINQQHKDTLSLSQRIGVWVVNHLATMVCVYVFLGIGIAALIGNATSWPFGIVCGSLSSQVIQLVLLPLIMIGQNVQGNHAEFVAEATFKEVDDIHRKLDRLLKK